MSVNEIDPDVVDAGFSAETIKVSEPKITMVPSGDHRAELIEVVVSKKDHAEGEELTLECKFQILSGESQNRTVRAWISVKHPTEWKQSIGQRLLKELCYAVDNLKPERWSHLCGTPVVLSIKTKDGGWPRVNSIQSDDSAQLGNLDAPAETAPWPAS